MTNFDNAMSHILHVEGGFVDNPVDRGGTTNFGITLKTLSEYLGHPATVQELKDMSMFTVHDVYRVLFWNRLKLDEISDYTLCEFIMNQAVHRGVVSFVVDLQKLLGVQVDGIMGPKTIQALNVLYPKKLLADLLKRSFKKYARIVEQNPSQAEFIVGWINRINPYIDRLIS